MRDFNYEIKKRLGILGQNGDKTLELNLISYNGAKPKFDLRRWDRSGGGEKMLKGLTMTNEEAEALYEALTDYAENGGFGDQGAGR